MSVFKFSILLVCTSLSVTALFVTERWRTDSELEKKAAARTVDLEQRINQSAVLPSMLAGDPRIKEVLSERSSKKVSEANYLLKLVVDESEAAVAFLMDYTGTTVASSNFDEPVSFVGKNYGFRPYFVDAMKGSKSSFFAVGATTGVPGYFISAPIVIGSVIGGVIVVKLEPRKLPLAWKESDFVTLVTDELGVVILSTENNFLYKGTVALTEPELAQITYERRYVLSSTSFLREADERRWYDDNAESSAFFRVSSNSLAIEPWTLNVLTPAKGIVNRAVRNMVILFGIVLLASLLIYLYRQQKTVSMERAKTAARLKRLVDERTKELEQAQNALIAESNFSMLGRMSAAINHEINQPLASMRFDLATLRQILENGSDPAPLEEIPGDYDANSIVVNLDRTAKRISRVIETLRALPKHQESSFSPVDILAVVSMSIDSVRADRRVLSRYLMFDKTSFESNRYFVNGQSLLLQQALLNILYNALDAVAQCEDGVDPYIDVLKNISDEKLSIHIRDSGRGIDPLVQAVMFEPFESSIDKSEGLGLGLTLARQIVSLHSGTIHCSRERSTTRDQELTVFTIELPLMSQG